MAAIAAITPGAPDAPAEHAATPTNGTGTAAWALDLLPALRTYDGLPAERYDRDTYDQGWLDLDGDCQSGRHELLIIESIEPVSFDATGCRVETGLWIDPYTGSAVRSAQDASVDHVVSFADAHRSGGWRWSEPWRVAFGHDLADPATLAISTARVNSAKGSDAPDAWMPDGAEARCAYAVAWVRIKTRWQLALTAPERDALDETLRRCDQQGLPREAESAPLEIVDFSQQPLLPVNESLEREPLRGDEPCDARYESVCIPAADRDLDCADIEPRRFEVTLDPHGFDGDDDGIGCER